MTQVVDAVVTVRLFAAAKAAAGCTQTTVAPGTLETVVAALHAQHPALASVTSICSYLVDGTRVREDDDVPAGATLDVLPPFAGG